MNCPFYGRHMYVSRAEEDPREPPFLLLDSQGNQCALVRLAHAPCQLEVAGRAVEWGECKLVKEVRP